MSQNEFLRQQDKVNGKWYTDHALFFFLLLKIFFKFYLNIFKDFLIKGCLSLAADRFTFPQNLPVTDSITVYNTSNHSFCTKISKKYYCCCRCLLV